VATIDSLSAESLLSNEVSFGPVPSTVDLSTGLIGYWNFNNCDAVDVSGNLNSGIISGGVSCSTGVSGYSLLFNGLNGYVSVPNSENKQINTNRITVSAFVKLDSDVGFTQKRIINKEERYGYNLWGMEIFGNNYHSTLGDIATGNNLAFHDSNGSTYRVCLSNTNLIPNKWYHVTATDDAGEIRLYIDGNLDKTCTNGYGVPNNINAPVVIGKHSSLSDFYFNGNIDDVRLYNTL